MHKDDNEKNYPLLINHSKCLANDDNSPISPLVGPIAVL